MVTGILVGQGLWAKTYGGTYMDIATSIVQTSDHGFAVAGYTQSFGAGLDDFLVFKVDSAGNLNWARAFGGSSYDRGWAITQTTDGGYAIAGRTRSFGAGGEDVMVLRLNSSGNLSWARTFGGTEWEFVLLSLVQTTDGGFIMAGGTYSFGAGSEDVLVLKVSSSGNLDWARAFGGTGDEYAYSIIQTADGGFAVAGLTLSFGAGNEDFFVLKIDGAGALSWARTFGGAATDYAWSIVQTADSGFVVAGVTTGFGMGGNEVLAVKLNPSGDLSWARTFGQADWDFAYCVTRTADGGLALGGLTHSCGAGASDLLVMKTDASGWLYGARTFGLASYDGAFSVAQTTDGGFTMLGYVWRSGSDYDAIVLRLDPDMNYPNCVQACNLSAMTPSISVSSPAVTTTSSSLTVMTPSLATATPNLTVSNVCEPYDVEEKGFGSKGGITCTLTPGGVLFLSGQETLISIYAADGRLVYCGKIGKGENRINLETGVYLWMAGTEACPYKGKAVVR